MKERWGSLVCSQVAMVVTRQGNSNTVLHSASSIVTKLAYALVSVDEVESSPSFKFDGQRSQFYNRLTCNPSLLLSQALPLCTLHTMLLQILNVISLLITSHTALSCLHCSSNFIRKFVLSFLDWSNSLQDMFNVTTCCN